MYAKKIHKNNYADNTKHKAMSKELDVFKLKADAEKSKRLELEQKIQDLTLQL